MKILVTGSCGFIGSHVCEFLLEQGEEVLGLDIMNEYYDKKKKQKNLEMLQKYENFVFVCEDMRTTNIIEKWKPDKIIHLASMVGVRDSIKHPHLYNEVNVGGFIHILEESVKNKVKHLVYASSSSVYGTNTNVPFTETDELHKLNSPYACSKMAMEIYARMYSQLYGLTNIGLRFFTVYGPRGRPDMAPYKFIHSIEKGIPIDKYGDGTTMRDYTYIDDIVSGIIGALDNHNGDICEIYNLGNSNPISLNQFIEICERVCGKKAVIREFENQRGDVPITYANIEKANKSFYYSPNMDVENGLRMLHKYILEEEEKE